MPKAFLQIRTNGAYARCSVPTALQAHWGQQFVVRALRQHGTRRVSGRSAVRLCFGLSICRQAFQKQVQRYPRRLVQRDVLRRDGDQRHLPLTQAHLRAERRGLFNARLGRLTGHTAGGSVLRKHYIGLPSLAERASDMARVQFGGCQPSRPIGLGSLLRSSS